MRCAYLLLLAASMACASDAIYVNGTVITVDGSRPYAEAFAVTNGRFSAVGTTAEIRRLATPETKVVDLKGMTVTPGFNDVHLHPVGVYDETSRYYTPWLGPEKVHNMDELIAALKAKADKTPPGQMVNGSRYQDTKLGRHPTRYDLDKASTTHPIRISHSSGHIIVVNSYILEASGITKETKDPPGGSFDRDPDGTPNGVIREGARRLLTAQSGATNERVPFADEVQGYLRCFRDMPSAASPAPESPAAAPIVSPVSKLCATPAIRCAWVSCSMEAHFSGCSGTRPEERFRRRPAAHHFHQGLPREFAERPHLLAVGALLGSARLLRHSAGALAGRSRPSLPGDARRGISDRLPLERRPRNRDGADCDRASASQEPTSRRAPPHRTRQRHEPIAARPRQKGRRDPGVPFLHVGARR